MPKKEFAIYDGIVISPTEVESIRDTHSSVVSPNRSGKGKSRQLVSPDPQLQRSNKSDRICRFCGHLIGEGAMEQHIAQCRLSGGRSQKKRQPSSHASQPVIVKCQFCSSSVKEDRLERHLRKMHPTKLTQPKTLTKSTASKDLVKCDFCNSFVRRDRLTMHKTRVHPAHAAQSNQKPSSIIEHSKIQVNSPVTKDTREQSVIQSDRETIFGDKYVGQYRREFDGKFGSIPLHDDYNDEADAE